MTEYKVWAFARSAAPNLPALEEQLAEVMREADRRGYIIVNSCMEQKYGTEFWRPSLFAMLTACLLYTSPSPRDTTPSRMPSSA